MSKKSKMHPHFSFLIPLIFAAAAFFTEIGISQGQEDDKSAPMSRFGVFVGNLLPDQIQGVTEILPVWGFRYAFPRKKNLVEIGAMSGQSLGVNFATGSLSVRTDILLEGLYGIVYAGVDVHYYKSYLFAENKTAGGGHVGGGVVAPLSPYFMFRTDMKFNINPGVSLFIGFGFELLFPPDGDKGAGDKK